MRWWKSDDTRMWWKDPWLYALLAVVGATYLVLISDTPIRGEESRWARGAVLMLETGDWIVPRQQGQVFPERPPLNSWLMAICGTVRGEVDLVAIRLPSVLAILATCALIFAYGRTWLSQAGAFVAASAYVTFGQVLQIGRFGESEAVFTFLVSASLLVWHALYLNKNKKLASWCWIAGYALAALAALAKGVQAPVYFVAATWLYVLIRRDFKSLFCRTHVAGVLCGVGIVAAWQLPFFWMTDLQATLDVWTGLARDRVSWAGLLRHMVEYPVETMVCLLPWSPLLLQFIYKSVRGEIQDSKQHLGFLLLCLAITYPSVWLVAGARGRYYMPLYPCIALLIGWIAHVGMRAEYGGAKRGWQAFLLVISVLVVGMPLILASLWTLPSLPLGEAHVPWMPLGAIAALGGICAWWLSVGCRDVNKVIPGTLALVAWLGFLYCGVVMHVQRPGTNDITTQMQEVRETLGDEPLVSLGPVFHRFAYYYKTTIPEHPWPLSTQELSGQVTYFCFDVVPSATPEVRSMGRGRSWELTHGTLPFEWQEVARVVCDPRVSDTPRRTVVIGRVVRDQSGNLTAVKVPMRR